MNLKLSSIQIPSRFDDNLIIDSCYIPSHAAYDGLIIISSGVHGIEGLVGSAIQRMFIREILPEHIDFSKTGVLIIHSINPYGHKYFRRVSENNVDLNRNFDIDGRIFKANNHAYSKLEFFLNPKKAYAHNNLKYSIHLIKTLAFAIKFGPRNMRQAILQGQYQYSKGIFWGGNRFESQINLLRELISKTIKPYQCIIVIDLHTGYGKRGKLYLLPYIASNSLKLNNIMNKLFEGYEIEAGSLQNKETEFYRVTGSFIEYVRNLSKKEQICIPIAFEFGTLNSDKKIGQIRSLQIMIEENQGFHYGYRSKRDEEMIKDVFKEMYFPSDPVWRNQIMIRSRETLKKIINRFQCIYA